MNRRRILVLCVAVLFPTAAWAADPAGDPRDLESSVAMMAKIGAAWSPSFSPNGKRIAFVSNLNGVPQIWTVASEGGWPDLVTALDDPVGSVSWSPDGSWLAFSLAPGGGMNQQVYVVRPDGTGLRRLTDGGKENNWLGDWTHDSRALTLASNRSDDTNVPVVEAEQVVESLKKRNVPVEYILFPDEGHGFRKIPNRIRSTVSIVQWFAEHLKN